MEKQRYERPIIQKMNTGLMNKFGTKTENEPVTHIESVTVKSLLKDYGSPLFVISEKQIRRNIQNGLKLFRDLNTTKQ